MDLNLKGPWVNLTKWLIIAGLFCYLKSSTWTSQGEPLSYASLSQSLLQLFLHQRHFLLHHCTPFPNPLPSFTFHLYKPWSLVLLFIIVFNFLFLIWYHIHIDRKQKDLIKKNLFMSFDVVCLFRASKQI
jgi:hypothetical protein